MNLQVIDMKYVEDGPLQCDKCAGCGYITDGESADPWKYWAELPYQSSFAIQVGLVKPIKCPVCKGTGEKEKV